MQKEDLRIVFMGTPQFAVATLKALVEGGYNVVAVVTQPDKPVGRHGSVLHEPDVKVYAREHGIPVLQPVKMKDADFTETLRSYNADLQIVVAFRMLPEIVWNMPRFGTFNVHAALLPQYRGAAPINWAIINGETKTGITTFFLDHDIDTGHIIQQETFDIPDDADYEFVYNGLMSLGAKTAISTVEKIIEGAGMVDVMPQSYFERQGIELYHAPKLFKENCQIDWNAPCKRIYDFIRGLSPIPGAWAEVIMPNGNLVEMKFYETRKTDLASGEKSPGAFIKEKKHCYIACQDFLLELVCIQPSGKKRMDAMAFANGIR